MRVRVDRGSGSGKDLAPGRGSLLGAFAFRDSSTKRAPAFQERRSEPRHKTVECVAWVGWRVFRDFKMTNALVINISRSGAQIFLDAPPPHYRSVWVFLETPRDKKIVKARVHQFRKTAAGQCMAHIQFSEPCPYEFFEAAVCGQAASDPKTRAARVPNRMAAS
jgi:hypothetical protein